MKKVQLSIVVLFVVLAGILRFYNLNWDEGHFFHPDERNIANAVSQLRFFDQLNPNFFAYGGFSIYLYRAVGDLLTLITDSNRWVFEWGDINLVGRHVAALFSTLTIIPLFFLSKKLFNEKTAHLASLFFAFCVGSIQIAHFAITENIITFFGVTLCLLAIFLYSSLRLKYFIASGVVLGLAIASKTTAASFVLFPLVAMLFLAIKLPKQRKKLVRLGLYILIFTITASLFFFIFSPYTFLSWNKFMESMRYESGVALGTLPVPYTLQFTHTIPYVFQLKNFLWQMGPVAVAGIIGLVYLIFKSIRKKNPLYSIFISFPLVYFLYVGAWHTKFIRFMLPLLPFLIISGAYILVLLHKYHPRIGAIAIAFFVSATFVWTMAYMSVYTAEQTRITASRWIYEHISPESRLLGEHWDDGLPVPLPPNQPSNYNITQLPLYDEDTDHKRELLAQELSTSDYIIINSRRLYGTLIHLSEQYPLTGMYYKKLFSGALGYEKVAEFSSYPNLFGIEIVDDGSEETFQVYDHPKVMIFENVKRLSQEELHNLLN